VSSATVAVSGRVGAEQADSTALEGERKTVTMLFADIKGSMDLIEDLDPEEARAIVDPALKLMMEAVRHYGGYVAQQTGDGIFALFGAPVALEDHPQRALLAALRIQQELKRYSDRTRIEGRLPIQARVGVNTGEVVVRSIATGEGRSEYAPVGHSTGIAARMQALAPIGSIATTEQIRKLCEGYFVFKSLGPTKVKGVSEPVNVYEVTGLGALRTRLQRGAARGYTKFVGRQREMETLKDAAELAKTGHGQVVAAVAEHGVGKSRLFFEFQAKHQSGWMVVEAFSVSHGKASAYLAVLDFLHAYFKIASEDDTRTRREKVTGRVFALDRTLEDTLSYLFALLGIAEGEDPLGQMDAQVKKRRTLDAIKRILLRESLNQPLIVMFEDLHWIDEQTQEFLNLLADSLANARLLLLVNYRPEYSHPWGSKTYYTQLRLDPLGTESAEEMLSALLGGSADLAPLKKLIIERTEGNPFFMEEMYQAMLEDGVIARNGAVKLVKPLQSARIPTTVQGVLSARIDRLPADAKQLLQTLSVIGREFPLSLIRAVLTRSDDELNRMLNDLQLGEFIYEQPALGDTEFIFKHALTQEVAHNQVLIERRRVLHGQIGAALETLHAKSLDDHLTELAHHYGNSPNAEKGLEYLQRAGRQAAQRSAYSEAVADLTAGLKMLKDLPESSPRTQLELDLQLALAPALRWTKGVGSPENERAWSRARELCEALGERTHLFAILQGLESHHLVQLNLATARELVRQLLALATDAADPTKLMVAHGASAQLLMQHGDLAPARQHFDLASPDMNWSLVDSLNLFYPSMGGWTLWELGYPEQALRWNRACLGSAASLSRPALLSNALGMSAQLQLFLRNPRRAQQDADAAIAIATENNLLFERAYAIYVRGLALAQQGHDVEGIAEIHRGIRAVKETGFKMRSRDFAHLAEVSAAREAADAGLKIVEEGLALVEEKGERAFEAELYRLRGVLLLKQEPAVVTEAERNFRTAIEVARRQGARLLELRATVSLARLLRDTKRRDEARAMLAEIYNWFTEGFDTPDLKDAKALLDQLTV
jgi:class 3 adenylate cyclase